MLNRIVNVAFLLFFLVPVYTLSAQKIELKSFHLNSGATVPTSNNSFGEYFQTGPNFGAGVTYSWLEKISININALYSKIPFDSERFHKEVETYLPTEGNDMDIFYLTSGLTFKKENKLPKLNPYVSVKAGYLYKRGGNFYDPTIDNKNISRTSALIVSVSAGTDYYLKELLSIFIEGEFASGFTKDNWTYFFPVKLGFRYFFKR